jgi:hypothetical protein
LFSKFEFEDWVTTDPVYSFSVFQQAISAVSVDSEFFATIFAWLPLMVSPLDNDCYELDSGCYAVYGFEYKPGFASDDAVCIPYPPRGSPS